MGVGNVSISGKHDTNIARCNVFRIRFLRHDRKCVDLKRSVQRTRVDLGTNDLPSAISHLLQVHLEVRFSLEQERRVFLIEDDLRVFKHIERQSHPNGNTTIFRARFVVATRIEKLDSGQDQAAYGIVLFLAKSDIMRVTVSQPSIATNADHPFRGFSLYLHYRVHAYKQVSNSKKSVVSLPALFRVVAAGAQSMATVSP